MNNETTITINGVEYVPKSSVQKLAKAEEYNGMPYVIVRTYSAGVFAGYLESRNGQEVVLRNARRIWYWEGAASLSELAVHGAAEPEKCKFPTPVEKVELLNAIEILECTKKAQEFIQNLQEWKFNS